MVTVLFIEKNSIYKTLGVDCYDIDRDALTFAGSNPVICHPPCRLWSRMRLKSTAPPGEKQLAIWAVEQIRKNGGVLEHPMGSSLFKELHLPLYPEKDEYGGYTIRVDQFHWGHPCRKATMLYIVGCPLRALPPMPLRFDAIEYVLGTSQKASSGNPLRRKEAPKSWRSRTPEAFAKWLIQIVEIIAKNRSI